MTMFKALDIIMKHLNILDEENEFKMMYYLHTCDNIYCQDCENNGWELHDVDMPNRCAMNRLLRTCKTLLANIDQVPS